MDQIDGRVERIEESLSRLTAQVAGDGTALAPGIVGLLDRNSKSIGTHADRILRVEKSIDRARWSVAAGASVGSLLGGGLVYLISELVGRAS